METSELVATVVSMHEEARRRRLFFQQTSDDELRGRQVTVDGRSLLSFSSCSYLGLERHPALVEGCKAAVDRYGTQFSSSRGYLSAPPYAELEARLGTLFGGHVLVTATTGLAHQSALPVLATEKDAIVLDHQAHHTMHAAATLCRAGGTRVELVRHGELDGVAELIERLSRTSRTVWFLCDGVFSMYGDLAPVGLLRRLLALAPNLRLYIDDAHGMSWAGTHGRGSFLARMPLDERVVVATSMAKGFACGGGILVFASAAERDRVRLAGGPMLFSGPLQPPMLGAALGSASVHLSPELDGLQAALAERVRHADQAIARAGLPLLSASPCPIRFLPLGIPRLAFEVASRLMADGVYVSVSAYPTVPMKRAGIRFSVTAAHTLEEIDRAVAGLATHIPAVLDEAGVTRAELDALFAEALPEESRRRSVVSQLARLDVRAAEPEVEVETHTTIRTVDRAVWDGALGAAAAVSWDAMATAEEVFRDPDRPEHDWRFTYVLVRSADTGALVAATVLTTALSKDDMLARAEVSAAVEERRRADPYFLTSTVVMMGSLLSEGSHLWLDRRGPWRAALRAILDVADREVERSQAAALVLRDFHAAGDAGDDELERWFLEHGLVRVPMLPSHRLDARALDDDAMLARLGARSRKALRQVLDLEPSYRTVVHHQAPGALDGAALAWLHELYLGVAARKLQLNVFPLPARVLPAMLASPAWELVTLHLDPAAGGPADGRPVAFWAAHRHGETYAPFFCGLDYRHVGPHGAYRQLLLQTIRRARALGLHDVRLGMSADVEKARFGTTAAETCAYVQAHDHYQGALLREIIAEVGVGRAAPHVAA
ncbi:MAG TPA: bifunctional aminotransferase class I/II-fold pyridoxal phosphate-dependent enzyme/GNAT family N-acetyltransferase [Kofleriaceae bacterium]|nr:bifunctional aminotransferase class I/II-fold pyridoxal phosphate-dependent enzyme/GNAT family N-acetyltransferase [Kofleriaceae bacterium]